MKKPTIPPVTTNDPTVTRALASIKEAIELREGDRGDPQDAFVSFRDLIEGGIAVLAGAGLNPDDIFAQLGRSRNSTRLKVQRIEALGAPPAAPLNLTTSIDGFTSILLSWEGTGYENHSYTEIWRNSADDRSTAVQVGSAPGTLFSDAVLYSETYYYWVRFVNIYNLRSGYNSLSGVLGKTNKKISDVIAAQQDELVASAFAASFLSTVNSVFQGGISAPTTKSDGRALVAGDLWFDADGAPKRYNGTAFVDAADPAISVAQSAATDAAALADKKVQIFHQADAPPTIHYQDGQPADTSDTAAIGELWVDTDDNNSVHIRTSSTQFVPYTGTVVPIDVGDLWLNTSAISATDTTPKNILNRYSGTAWVVVQDSGIGIATSIAQGKTTIHYLDDQPTDAASEVGDLWVDTNDDNSVHRRTGAETWTALGLATNAGVNSKITEQVGVCMFQPIDVTVGGVTTTPSPYVATGETTKSGCEAATSVDASGNPLGTYSWDNTGAIAQTLDVVTSSVGTNTTTISTQASSINGLEGQYILKVATNNAVAGFGLAVDTSATSEFFILADKFGIINSSDDALTTATAPFIVANEVDAAGNPITKTYINSAVIKAADIENLVADGITAERITILDEFTAWRADIETLQADVIQDKAQRFTLDMNNGFISVTDANGVLRVKLGKLSV